MQMGRTKRNQKLWFWLLILGMVVPNHHTVFGQTPVGTLIISDTVIRYTDAGLAAYSAISDTIATPVLGGARLQVNISSEHAFLAPIDTMRWVIEVRNEGNIPAIGVRLQNVLTGPIRIITADAGGEISGTQVDWPTPFDLAPGESIFRTVSTLANQDAPVGIIVPSQVSATASNIADAAQNQAAVTVDRAPALSLLKTANKAQAAPGETVTYSLSYTNNGNAVAVQPRLNDQLPQQLLFISADPAPTQILGNVFTWVLEDVAPNTSGAIELTTQIKPAVPLKTNISNQITSATSVPNIVGKTVVHTSESLPSIVVVQSNLMTLSKTVETTQNILPPGGDIVYLITVGNKGGQKRPVVTLIDTIPNVLTLSSVETDATTKINGQILQVQWTPFPANSEAIVRVSARVKTVNPLPSSVGNRAWLITPDSALMAEAPPVFLQSKFDGQLSQSERIIPGETVVITVNDFDLNADPVKSETVQIPTVNIRTGEQEAPLLTETAPNSGIFTGHLSTFFGESPGNNGDNLLLVQGNDVIRSTYTDTSTTSGTSLEHAAETIVNATRISLYPVPRTLVANGIDQAFLTALITDNNGNPLPDGTPVQLSADKGTFENGENLLIVPISGGNGQAIAFYTAPILASSDTARVFASFGGIDSDVVGLEVLPGAIGVRVFDQDREVEVDADDRVLVVTLTLVGTTVTGDPVTLNVSVDENKLFVVPDIPPGNYELRSLVTDKNTGEIISNGVLQTVVVKPDGSTTPPKNAISGTLRSTNNTSDARFAGTTVELLNDRGEIVATTQLDEHGRYDFQGIPAGSYKLRAQFTDGTQATATVSSRSQLIGAIIINADIHVRDFHFAPVIAFTKTVAKTTAFAGETVDFQLVVANVGNDTARSITIRDTLSTVWQMLQADGGQVLNANIAQWRISNLPQGHRDTLVLKAIATRPNADQAIYTNRAWVEGDGILPIQSQTEILVRVPQNLSLSKRVNATTVSPGNNLVYTLILSYQDSVATTKQFAVIDSLPATVAFVSATNNPTINDNVLTWLFDGRNPYQTDTLSLTTRLMTEDQPIINTAYLQHSGQSLSSSNTVTTTIQQVPDIWLTKNADRATVQPGERIAYQIEVGSHVNTLRTVTIRDTLPPEMTYIEGSAQPQATYDVQAHVLFWTLQDVSSERHQTLNFELQPRQDLTLGEHRVQNVATASFGATTFFSNAVEVMVVVPYFKLEKTAHPTTAEAGDFVVYRIVLKNLSATDSLGVISVQDVLPQGFKYVENTARTNGQYDAPTMPAPGKLSWTITGLGAGQTQELTYRLVLGTDAEYGDGINTVTATANTEHNFVLSANQAQARVRVRPGLFTHDEVIIGKAWVDLNKNGIMERGEPPVPEVVMLMEDGTRIIADRHGQFSIPEVKTGDHVLRLLNLNIPVGLQPAVLGTRSASDPWVRFVHLSPSGLSKANFPFHLDISFLKKTVQIEKPAPHFWLERNVYLDPTEKSFALNTFSFESGSAQLTPLGNQTLETWFSQLKTLPDQTITINGHTDNISISNDKFPNNAALSLARAEAVKAWLITAGLNATRIHTKGYGATRPIASNDTPEERRQNRRIEIDIQASQTKRFFVNFKTHVLATKTHAPFVILQHIPPGYSLSEPDTASIITCAIGDSVTYEITAVSDTFPLLPHPHLLDAEKNEWELQWEGQNIAEQTRDLWQGVLPMAEAVSTDSVWAGSILTYYISAVAPAGSQVLDVIPQGLALLSSDTLATAMTDTLRWQIAVPETLAFWAKTKVDVNHSGTITNKVILKTQQNKGDLKESRSDSVQVAVVPRPQWNVQITTTPDTLKAFYNVEKISSEMARSYEERLTRQVSIRYLGDESIPGVQLADILAPGMHYDAGSSSSPVFKDGENLRWVWKHIKPGDILSVTYRVYVYGKPKEPLTQSIHSTIRYALPDGQWVTHSPITGKPTIVVPEIMPTGGQE